MKKRYFVTVLAAGVLAILPGAHAQPDPHALHHQMQHGFVLSADDSFASHLVANGHHSRQAEITGQLLIEGQQEKENYVNRKTLSAGGSYFLFQAQNLDLPSLKPNQVLTGHISESKVGMYEPANIIVRRATFTIKRVLLNIENPFFGE
jgi:hypothetical protein